MTFKFTFHCDGCQKDRDFDSEYGILIIRDKAILRVCRECRRPKAFTPDVYFDGKPEENLADDPNTGLPRVFSSKGEKAAYLRDRGIMEAGDRVHGAPLQLSSMERKTDSQYEVKMALKKVREMGIDNRRQEFYRIQRERERLRTH